MIARAPTAWQEINGQRVDVAVSFVLLPANRVGFSLGAYDPTYELIIDPTMDYSGVFGGSEDGKDYAYDVALDEDGNVYLTGETYSAQFPDGSGQPTSGGSDAFVMKLVWNEGETEPSEIITTYLGGSEDDAGQAIAVDDSGHIYVSGRSTSDDFPLVNNLDEDGAAFVTKLTPDGTVAVYSTRYESDTGEDIALDASNNAYLVGKRTVWQEWSCPESAETTEGQTPDYVTMYTYLTVARLSWDGVNLSIDTYPTVEDKGGRSLALASDGTLYVATWEYDRLDGSCPGPTGMTETTEDDGDIVVYDGNGALVGTYDAMLENGERLWPTAVSLDDDGHLFATGWCDDEGNTKACVAAFQTSDMSLLDSVYLGGSGTDYAFALDADTNGNVYVTGYTDSADFPQIFPTSSGGGEGDVFIARYYFDGEELSPNFSSLNYSSLLGGTDTDYSTGIAVDANGHAYVTGYTYSGDYPTTPGEPPEDNTNGDVILSRITFTPSTKYYFANGQLVSFERADYPENNGRRYVFRDHLGSTSVIVNGQGERLWEDRFYPFGDVRDTYRKDNDPDFPVQTAYRYTGQRLDVGVGASATAAGLDRGLYFYNSRYYDSSLGRFLQADTIVPEPGNPQSLNRYSYANNNALRYTDPSGHYGSNVHYGLTYVLARDVGQEISMMAGLSVEQSERVSNSIAGVIARADQGVDQNPTKFPLNIVELGGMSPTEYYHFQSRAEGESRLQKAIAIGDPQAFGEAMHTFQDYFSHTGSGFSFPSGQEGLDNLRTNCPECFTGGAWASNPRGTAQLLGHIPGQKLKNAFDEYNPYAATDHYSLDNPRDVAMYKATEYWITMWYLSQYGVDPDQYYMDQYGLTADEYYSQTVNQ